jgi:hypothetical protein
MLTSGQRQVFNIIVMEFWWLGRLDRYRKMCTKHKSYMQYIWSYLYRYVVSGYPFQLFRRPQAMADLFGSG